MHHPGQETIPHENARHTDPRAGHPSGYTSAASAAATDFDSFVSATGVSSASLNDFHSFVSTVAESEGSLERFNSNPPAGFVLIVR